MLESVLGNRTASYFLIIVGICLFSLLPMRLKVRFSKKTNIIKVQVVLWLWIIPLRINLVNPLTRFFWGLSARKPWQKKAPQDISAREIHWLSLISRSRRIMGVTQKIWRRANAFYLRHRQQISLTQLTIAVEIGWLDAACTAISVGVFWSVLAFIYNSLTRQFNTQNSINDFTVSPAYTSEGLFNLDISCIFEFRFGHIIIIIYQILRNSKDINQIIRRASI